MIDPSKLAACYNQKLCWVCGERLGSYLAFVTGPMCAINRTSSEPPSHKECAVFSATACPFLTTPKEKRREAGLPEGVICSETGLKRNPGVALVWITKSFKPIRGLNNEILFRIGEPVETLWFCEGRKATRAEVDHSVETGLPLLMELAEQEGQPAVRRLNELCQIAARFYPAPSSVAATQGE